MSKRWIPIVVTALTIGGVGCGEDPEPDRTNPPEPSPAMNPPDPDFVEEGSAAGSGSEAGSDAAAAPTVTGDNEDLKNGTGGAIVDVDVGVAPPPGGKGDFGDPTGIGSLDLSASSNPPMQPASLGSKVALGTTESELGENKDAAQSIVRRNLGQLRYCHESRLKINPSVEGTVTVKLTIEAGKVESSDLIANTTNDDQLGQCAVKKMYRWRFPDSFTGWITVPVAMTVDR